MERFIIIVLLILILALTRYWRRKLGEAYCAAAKYAPTLELRREFSRKAVLAEDFPHYSCAVCCRPSAVESVQEEENPLRIYGLLLPIKVQPIPE